MPTNGNGPTGIPFFSGNTIELVPITMAVLHLCHGDVNQSMIEAARFGRDTEYVERHGRSLCAC